ncbi:Acg family FMN-binding oxidoreductase [Streptomyces cyanogenus]|uniref:NAD(P)H nitroreductase n=1 Tax=Streptomyces cyanogenus TaxID=80860 RepID=A0ABX7U2G9_STRCY|nr:nitroreductase family protein [Streptomyces cyanogenus]QTE01959.1 Putative NAD(P)H nitroreductase [Streptomyces cyanogenus]
MRTAPLGAAALEDCISAAVAAPSIYNTQPWRFRLDPDNVALEVCAAPERALPHADPVGRALHLSVGAAVFNLRVAATHFGWAPVVRLLPDPEDPSVLAILRLSGMGQRHAAGHRPDLYPMIWRRHSSRVPFSGRPLPPNVRAELAEAAHTEGASLSFPGAAETARVLRVATEAEHRNRADADRAVESRRWVHRDPDDPTGVGIPQAVLGPQDARERLPMRDFTAQRRPERLPAQPFESLPAIALLTTGHDRRSDWLRAGQALEHVLLAATAHGMRASLLHQPMEWPDLRRDLSHVPDRTGHAQMLVRLGYGPEGPATPRRAPDQVW